MTAKRFVRKSLLLSTLLLAGGLTVAHAAPEILAMHTFDDNVEGWTMKDYDGAIGDELGVLSYNAGGYLRVDVASSAGGREDLVFAAGDTDGRLLGNWQTKSGGSFGVDIVFDFYAETGSAADPYPGGLMVYFENTDGDLWMYNLTQQAVDRIGSGGGGDDNWYTFRTSVGFGSQGGWSNPDGGGSWANAFTDVSEVGVYLVYPAGDVQHYGIDNFGLTMPIPEPGTWMMLGSALMSLSVTFRKKIGLRARELLNS